MGEMVVVTLIREIRKKDKEKGLDFTIPANRPLQCSREDMEQLQREYPLTVFNITLNRMYVAVQNTFRRRR
jgi:hypothetical protein